MGAQNVRIHHIVATDYPHDLSTPPLLRVWKRKKMLADDVVNVETLQRLLPLFLGYVMVD
jgi:hypothetical protein